MSVVFMSVPSGVVVALAALLAACGSSFVTHGTLILRQNAGIESLLADGIVSADGFRRALVSGGDLDALSEAIAGLHDELTPEAVTRAISGEATENVWETLEPFAGQWEGEWDGAAVQHDWDRVTYPEVPSVVDLPDTSVLEVVAWQYAWVGTGFGWNVEVRQPDEDSTVLLGSVYHLDPNTGDVAYHIPHVGVPVDETTVIWIVPDGVFLEQVDGEGRYRISLFERGPSDDRIPVDPTYETTYLRPGTHDAD